MTSDSRDVEAHQGIQTSSLGLGSRLQDRQLGAGGRKEWLAATSLGHSEWQASASSERGPPALSQALLTLTHLPKHRASESRGAAAFVVGSWVSVIKINHLEAAGVLQPLPWPWPGPPSPAPA